MHDFGVPGPLAPLVADGDRRIVAEPLGERARAHHAANVGRDDHDLAGAERLQDVARKRGRGEQVVGRNIEEALDLARVQVECHDTVDAGALDQVGDTAWPRSACAGPDRRSCRA